MIKNHVQIAESRYGKMIYPTNDIWVGRSFMFYGEFSELETDVFKRCINQGDTVVDAGANIGSHTLLLSRLVSNEGKVLAFEPNPTAFGIAYANMLINNCWNVNIWAKALGEKEGSASIEIPEYTVGINLGGARISSNDTNSENDIPITTLDSFNLQQLHFLKADVEGYEGKLLEGAKETIDRCRPFIYLENEHGDREALIRQVHALGYDIWRHQPPLYNPDNFYRNPANAFVAQQDEKTVVQYVSMNIFCAPAELNFCRVIVDWDTKDNYVIVSEE